MSSVSVVVQGKWLAETIQLLENIKLSKVFDEVIVSCWETCEPKYDCKIVKSDPPENAGMGNRNMQIVSSLRGVRESQGEVCAKLRSDQIISVDSLVLMRDFYEENRDNKHVLQSGSVCVAGIFRPFPFHPRDHIFWGPKLELERIFDIPLDEVVNQANPDYNHETRAESYIGTHYASKFDFNVESYLSRLSESISDGGRLRSEAMAVSDTLTAKIFKPFPRIQFSWPKHGLSSYHYHVTEAMGEYWNEEVKWKR
jgi:hypothetical protein